jgi:DNA-binding transcriptional LysR family regulator
MGVVDERLAEKGLSRRIALTVPNFMMALAQLAETDLIATLPRHLVMRHARRFGLDVAPVPLPWKKDPVRVVASKAAMADAGIVWMFDAIARCFDGGGEIEATSAEKRSNRLHAAPPEASSAQS